MGTTFGYMLAIAQCRSQLEAYEAEISSVTAELAALGKAAADPLFDARGADMSLAEWLRFVGYPECYGVLARHRLAVDDWAAILAVCADSHLAPAYADLPAGLVRELSIFRVEGFYDTCFADGRPGRLS